MNNKIRLLIHRSIKRDRKFARQTETADRLHRRRMERLEKTRRQASKKNGKRLKALYGGWPIDLEAQVFIHWGWEIPIKRFLAFAKKIKKNAGNLMLVYTKEVKHPLNSHEMLSRESFFLTRIEGEFFLPENIDKFMRMGGPSIFPISCVAGLLDNGKIKIGESTEYLPYQELLDYLIHSDRPTYIHFFFGDEIDIAKDESIRNHSFNEKIVALKKEFLRLEPEFKEHFESLRRKH